MRISKAWSGIVLKTGRASGRVRGEVGQGGDLRVRIDPDRKPTITLYVMKFHFIHPADMIGVVTSTILGEAYGELTGGDAAAPIEQKPFKEEPKETIEEKPKEQA